MLTLYSQMYMVVISYSLITEQFMYVYMYIGNSQCYCFKYLCKIIIIKLNKKYFLNIRHELLHEMICDKFALKFRTKQNDH